MLAAREREQIRKRPECADTRPIIKTVGHFLNDCPTSKQVWESMATAFKWCTLKEQDWGTIVTSYELPEDTQTLRKQSLKNSYDYLIELSNKKGKEGRKEQLLRSAVTEKLALRLWICQRNNRTEGGQEKSSVTDKERNISADMNGNTGVWRVHSTC